MKGQTKKQQPVSRRNHTFTVKLKDRDGKEYLAKEVLPIRVYGRLD